MILATVRVTAKKGKRLELQHTFEAICRNTKACFEHNVYQDAAHENDLLLISKWEGSRSKRPGESPGDETLGKLNGALTKLCSRSAIELHTVNRTTRNRAATAGGSQAVSYGVAAPGEEVVRAVESYIRVHLAEDVSTTELAAAAGVSARTLFRYFRALGRPSPMKMLATARLEQARRRLTLGKDNDTVTRIAMDSGLAHLGRFSALYKAKYGERPSETLRKARQRRASTERSSNHGQDDSRARGNQASSDWEERFVSTSLSALRLRHERTLGSVDFT